MGKKKEDLNTAVVADSDSDPDYDPNQGSASKKASRKASESTEAQTQTPAKRSKPVSEDKERAKSKSKSKEKEIEKEIPKVQAKQEAIVVADKSLKKMWSEEDVVSFVKGFLEKREREKGVVAVRNKDRFADDDEEQEEEETALVESLRAHLARHHFDLDLFDTDVFVRDELISLWNAFQYSRGKSMIVHSKFERRMNEIKVQSYGVRRN